MSTTKAVWDQVAAMNIDYQMPLGPIYTELALTDPKRLAFITSRYKFCAKMLKDRKRIVEVGCGECLGTLMLLADTKADILSLDFDESQISYANRTIVPSLDRVVPNRSSRVNFQCMDFLNSDLIGVADGLLSIDVIEHIEPKLTGQFLENCTKALGDKGVAIIGSPSEYAKPFASERSNVGHINLFTPDRFQETLGEHFSNVFLFSMNDEMIHTGFDKLAHYMMALCVK